MSSERVTIRSPPKIRVYNGGRDTAIYFDVSRICNTGDTGYTVTVTLPIILLYIHTHTHTHTQAGNREREREREREIVLTDVNLGMRRVLLIQNTLLIVVLGNAGT